MKTIQDVFEAARARLAVLFVFILTAPMPIEIHAAAPRFEWVRTAGGSGTDGAQAVATDLSGGVYLVGHFQGQGRFGSNIVGTPQGLLRPQAFVSKLDGLGNFVWTDTSRGTEFSTESFYLARSVAVGDGSIYVSGLFNGTAKFGNLTLAGTRERDFFVTKYSTNGTALWARRLGGLSELFTVEYFQSGVAVSGDGSVYVTGAFDNIGAFGSTNLTSAGSYDTFLTKFDPTGNFVWSRKFGGLRDDAGYSVVADAVGNCWLIMRFVGPANFGGVVLSGHPLNGVADSGRFYESSVGLVKCDSDGKVLWAKQESGGNEAPYPGTSKLSVSVDPFGNCFISGWVVDRTYNNWRNPRLFVSKYDSRGTQLWSERVGDGQFSSFEGDYSANAVAADRLGNCYVAGYFKRTAAFGITNLLSLGERDIFVAKYDAGGTLLWVKQAGLAFEDEANGLSLDNEGNLYVAGSFYDFATFDSTNVTGALLDAFVAKLPLNDSIPPGIVLDPASQTVLAGDTVSFGVSASGTPLLHYQWQFNGTNLISETNSALAIVDAQSHDEGNYRVVISNSSGSVTSAVAALTIAFPVSIIVQPLSQSVLAGTNLTMAVTADGTMPLSYQWRYDGLDIPGALAAAFTISDVQPANAGGYSVVVSNSYGSITSSVATLTVNFSLTVMKKGVGLVSIEPDQPSYTPGSVVNVRASASFLSWSGDANGTDNPLTVTMTSNLVIIANFAGPRLTPLGNLPGVVFDSEATAISGDGSTVVGFTSTAGPYHAFRWTESAGIVDLGSLPGGESHSRFAYGVSDDGGVIVGYSRYDDNRTEQAFRWTSNEGMVGIGFFPGSLRSHAWGISGDGKVIVGNGESAQGDLAFRWTSAEGVRSLGSITGSGFSSIAYSASSNGAVIVGGSQTGGVGGATLWTLSGGAVVLGHVSNGVSAVAVDISPDGKFVVGADQFGGSEIRSEAFRWSSSGFRTLGHIPGQLQNFAGLSVSADGEVIVGTEGDEAFIWTPGLGMRRLWDALISVGVNPAADGWTQLSGARGVSDDGRFVCGFGQRGGRRQAFRADLLPAAVPLTVLTNGNGSVVRSPEQPNYPANSTVSLTAVPGSGSYFVNWSGDATGVLNPITVAMTRRKSITANFSNTRLTLIPQGSGTILKSPDRGFYDLGEEVTLSAIPGPWHVFTRWNDGTSTNPRVITIRPNNTYLAVFSPTTAVETLTFSNVSRTAPVGMPAIFVDGDFMVTDAVLRLDYATVSMLTSFPNGAIFYTLDGSTPDFGANLYVGPFSMNRSVTLRAVAYDASFLKSWEADPLFLNIEPTYTMNAGTAGGGSVGVSPLGASYRSNTVINLTAFPDPGWTFLQWLGDASGTNSRTTARVTNRDLCVQAMFGTTFGTTAAGNGAVIMNPAAALYPYGTVVRLTALPQDGNYFGAWGNAVMSTHNPLLVTMTNANSSVSCVFGPLIAEQAALTVLVDGRGRVATTPGGNRFSNGQSVRLTATADADQDFLGWGGDGSGTSTNLTVSMTGSKVITANFTKRPQLALGPCLGGWRQDGFQLTLTGEIGGRYRIERASELPLWSPLLSFTNTYGRWQMFDSAASNSAVRFYRAVEEP